MKNGKRPTKNQSIFIKEKGLDPTVWLITKDTPDRMELVHRHSDRTTRTLHKEK